MKLLGMLDGSGVYGNIMHYAMVLFFVGSAFLIFLYLWRKGKLNMDEEAKYEMMRSEKEEEIHE